MLKLEPRPYAATGEWLHMALCVFCGPLICNSFRTQPYLSHFHITFTCYMFQIGHVSLSFSFLAGVTLPFSLHKTELICWSFLFEVKESLPSTSLSSEPDLLNFNCQGNFLPSFMVSKTKGILEGVCLQQSTWVLGDAPSQSQDLQMEACTQQ